MYTYYIYIYYTINILKRIHRGVSDAGSTNGHVGEWVDGWLGVLVDNPDVMCGK